MKRKSLPWVDHPTVRQVCDNPWRIPSSWSKLKMDTAKVNSVWILLSRGYEIMPPLCGNLSAHCGGTFLGLPPLGSKEWSLNFLLNCNMHAHMSDRFEAYKWTMAASYFCMKPILICTKGFDPLYMRSSMMLNRWAKLTDRSIKKLTCERHR